jgi:hypothetical protein
MDQHYLSKQNVDLKTGFLRIVFWTFIEVKRTITVTFTVTKVWSKKCDCYYGNKTEAKMAIKMNRRFVGHFSH